MPHVSKSAQRQGQQGLSARERAEALLQKLLGADDYRRLMQRGYLEVASPQQPGRIYRIPRRAGLVEVLEQGEHVDMLCIGPNKRLPCADVLVIHKLLIEADEETYVRTAGHFWSGRRDDWRMVNGRLRLAVSPWQDW